MSQQLTRVGGPELLLNRTACLALAASAGLSSIQFWMTVPLAALSLSERGIAPWQIGLIGAVPWLTLVLLIPLVPKLAARFRALRVFRIGCWLGLAGAAPSPPATQCGCGCSVTACAARVLRCAGSCPTR